MLAKATEIERLGGTRLRVLPQDGGIGEHDFAALTLEAGSPTAPSRDPTYVGEVALEWLRPNMPAGALRRPTAE